MYSVEEHEREYMQLFIKPSALFKRFETGKIGEQYNALMNAEESNKYLKENVYEWLKERIRVLDIHTLVKMSFKQIASRENIKHYIATIIFANALEEWTQSGGDLESIIIEMISLEELKKGIDIFKKHIKQLIINIKRSQFVSEEDECDYEYDNIYYMPYSEGCGKLN